MNYNNCSFTPVDIHCFGEKITLSEGNVMCAEHILDNTNSAVKLIYPGNSVKPKIIIDLGPSSPGGYPVFKVQSYTGEPVLRISYADWYDFIVDPIYSEKGDFVRGCCKYLGVELPVLPANPNRFELYSIHRTGVYMYPLIQGQQRFVMITLDTPDCEIALEYFYIRYTSDLSQNDGSFDCSLPQLTRLWYASTYTVQIASINNSHAWEIVENKLAVRALTKGNDCGIYKYGVNWENYTFSFDAQISVNPHFASGIGWAVRASDQNNGYAFQLNLDNTFNFYIRKDGVNHPVQTKIELPFPIFNNIVYSIKTKVQSNRLYICINDDLIAAFTDDTYAKGTIGFWQMVEKWAFVESLRVNTQDALLFTDDFIGSLDAYEFTRSPWFLADGAKRDRLPWIGDLDWAGRNSYYAFREQRYMRESLQLFSRHQTPEGYIWGTCYPENTVRPGINDFGLYESDLFSAWFVPTLADYVLFTNDQQTALELFPTVVKDLDYLWEYVEADGLFFQRYATSKGLWAHVLNDIGKYTYNNIVIMDAFAEGSFIASVLGLSQKVGEFAHKSAIMKKAILNQLWDNENGYFKRSAEDNRICIMSNSIGLALKMLSPEQAARAITTTMEDQKKNFHMGKILVLFIRGCFNYGYNKEAYSILTGSTGKTDYLGDCTVNWIDAVADEKGPATTTECMTYAKVRHTNGQAWGDMSHPDSAVAHLITGYILGIQPTDAGYITFDYAPNPCDLTSASGIIPTPFGDIHAGFEIKNDHIYISLTHPPETKPNIIIPAEYIEQYTIIYK
jgi:hypothetical protein